VSRYSPGEAEESHEIFKVRKGILLSANYRGADKSLARPVRKKSTATEEFDVHISYL
jgi:hypothetical protein